MERTKRMKKLANIIARKRIINPATMKIHDDQGLFALDGILYGKLRECSPSDDDAEIMQLLINEFEADHPDFFADDYELVTKVEEA